MGVAIPYPAYIMCCFHGCCNKPLTTAFAILNPARRVARHCGASSGICCSRYASHLSTMRLSTWPVYANGLAAGGGRWHRRAVRGTGGRHLNVAAASGVRWLGCVRRRRRSLFYCASAAVPRSDAWRNGAVGVGRLRHGVCFPLYASAGCSLHRLRLRIVLAVAGGRGHSASSPRLRVRRRDSSPAERRRLAIRAISRRDVGSPGGDPDAAAVCLHSPDADLPGRQRLARRWAACLLSPSPLAISAFLLLPVVQRRVWRTQTSRRRGAVVWALRLMVWNGVAKRRIYLLSATNSSKRAFFCAFYSSRLFTTKRGDMPAGEDVHRRGVPGVGDLLRW